MQSLLQAYLRELILNSAKTPINYNKSENFIALPLDERIVQTIGACVKDKLKERPKLIVVIGIGGSNLGAKAIYDALKEKEKLIPMEFLDQIDQKRIEGISAKIQKIPSKNVVLITTSKSGSTIETRVNYALLATSLAKTFKEINKFVVTGENARDVFEGCRINIPDAVGGRFSVFSAVGLLPLGLAGIDIKSLLEGAVSINVDALKGEKLPKETFKVYTKYKKGKNLYNIFVFSDELISLGHWTKQLIGESLGKNKKGFIPMVSVGSRDLHSLQQAFVGGPPIAQHEFVSAGYLNKYQDVLQEATENIYKQKKIPYRKTRLRSLSAKELGKYMQTKFLETLLLGKLLKINPFGQPDVDGYKQFARSKIVF